MILVPFCHCLFAFFRQSIVHYQSNSKFWIHTYALGNLKSGVPYAKFKIIIDKLFNFASVNLGLLA